MATQLLASLFLLFLALPAAAGSPSAQAIDELRARVDALTVRVAALEATPAAFRPVLVDSEGRLLGFPLDVPRIPVDGWRWVMPFPAVIFSKDGRAFVTFTNLVERVVVGAPDYDVTWMYADRGCAGTPYLWAPSQDTRPDQYQPTELHRFGPVPPGIPDEVRAAAVFRARDEVVQIQWLSTWVAGRCQDGWDGLTRDVRLPEAVELAPAVGPFHFEVR